MSAAREWKIGPHTIVFEPPRLLRLFYRGGLTLEQASALMGIYQELTRTHPVDLLGDMSAADPLSPEVQRYFGENTRPGLFRLSVYFGARLVHKAQIKGLALSNQMTERRLPPTEELMASIHYVATREEAEQLLGELRARLDGREG